MESGQIETKREAFIDCQLRSDKKANFLPTIRTHVCYLHFIGGKGTNKSVHLSYVNLVPLITWIGKGYS